MARSAQKQVEPTSSFEANATIGRLIEDLGSEILEILVAPRGLEVGVAEAVIYDPAGDTAIERDDIVLAVGAGSDPHVAARILSEAGARRASAVAMKLEDESTELVQLASDADVALLKVSPDLRWDQLHILVRTSIVSTGQPLGTSAGSVPIGDLFALSNAVSAMVGGPVTIEDPQSRVLAYSSLDEAIDEPRRQTILGRRVPEPWMKRLHEAGVFKKMWTTEEVVRFEGFAKEGLRPRIVTAVRAGGEILGSIWVQEGPRPLTRADEEALREAARIAALHLIRARSGRDIERRMRGDALRSILEGRGSVEAMASRLSLDTESGFTVMAFELESEEEADIALYSERLADLVAFYSEAFQRRAIATSAGRTVYSLIPSSTPAARERITRLAREIVAKFESMLKVKVRAGIGSAVDSLRSVPHSKWEADQALRLFWEGATSGKVGDIEQLRAHTVLLELKDLSAERPHLKLGKLQILSAHDEKHGTEYIKTLRAFLDFFGDIPAAASRVGVHPNTFRYRIRRLVEFSGLKLDDPEERLVAELQLRLI